MIVEDEAMPANNVLAPDREGMYPVSASIDIGTDDSGLTIRGTGVYDAPFAGQGHIGHMVMPDRRY